MDCSDSLRFVLKNNGSTMKVKMKTADSTTGNILSNLEIPNFEKWTDSVMEAPDNELPQCVKITDCVTEAQESELPLVMKKSDCVTESPDSGLALSVKKTGGVDLTHAIQHKAPNPRQESSRQDINVRFKQPPSSTARPIQEKSRKRTNESDQLAAASSSISCVEKQRKVIALVRDYNCGRAGNRVISLSREEFKEDEIVSRGLVGKGSFGQVWKMKARNGRCIVMKEMRPGTVEASEILTPFVHPDNGLVKVLGVKSSPASLNIYMEDAGPSLKWWLTNREDDSFRCWKETAQNLKELSHNSFKVLKYLESQAIVHRDIKPENICLTKQSNGANLNFKVTLIDFGSVQTSQDKEVPAGHTVEYLPPRLNRILYHGINAIPNWDELRQTIFFSEKCDVWGMALVFLTVFNQGFHPIRRVNSYNNGNIQCLRKRVMEEIMEMRDGHFADLFFRIQDPLGKALGNALRVEADRRWTAKEVCGHLEDDGQRCTGKVPRTSTNGDNDSYKLSASMETKEFDVGSSCRDSVQDEGKKFSVMGLRAKGLCEEITSNVSESATIVAESGSYVPTGKQVVGIPVVGIPKVVGISNSHNKPQQSILNRLGCFNNKVASPMAPGHQLMGMMTNKSSLNVCATAMLTNTSTTGTFVGFGGGVVGTTSHRVSTLSQRVIGVQPINDDNKATIRLGPSAPIVNPRPGPSAVMTNSPEVVDLTTTENPAGMIPNFHLFEVERKMVTGRRRSSKGKRGC